MKLRKDAEAINCIEKALSLSPLDSGIWFLKARVLENLEQFDEALECLERVLEIDPGYQNALEMQVRILKKNK